MATSRTGTTKWKRIVKQALREAQERGLTYCPTPGCGVELDYVNRSENNGATGDHVIPHEYGGRDHIDNVAIICKRCNSSKGKRMAPAPPKQPPRPFPLSRAW